MLTAVGSQSRELYRWQLDALAAWLRCGRRGVIEAVTGSGKTDVAIAAITDALDRKLFVLVVVPSRVLMEQWQADAADCLLAITLARLTHKEAAGRMDLSESQLAAQLADRERPQTERWRADDVLRGAYLLAHAMHRPEEFTVTTTITVRRIA